MSFKICDILKYSFVILLFFQPLCMKHETWEHFPWAADSAPSLTWCFTPVGGTRRRKVDQTCVSVTGVFWLVFMLKRVQLLHRIKNVKHADFQLILLFLPEKRGFYGQCCLLLELGLKETHRVQADCCWTVLHLSGFTGSVEQLQTHHTWEGKTQSCDMLGHLVMDMK